LDGEIPWASGAGHAQFIVAGAVMDDRSQILVVLPMNLPGVRVQPPMPLIALRGSHTASVLCNAAFVEDRQVLVGPVEQALAVRKKNLPIGQAFLATGLSRAALDLIQQIDSDSARGAHGRLASQLDDLRRQVLDYCNLAVSEKPDPARGAQIRGACIDLALRTTHAAVSLYKGTALLQGHPAQRLAREALFLLVWSCPAPVVDCTLDLLTT
jgi:alkylation response protein AidB-like acyl-CoA dehydrogenase